MISGARGCVIYTLLLSHLYTAIITSTRHTIWNL
jgi:hypothetical protein